MDVTLVLIASGLLMLHAINTSRVILRMYLPDMNDDWRATKSNPRDTRCCQTWLELWWP